MPGASSSVHEVRGTSGGSRPPPGASLQLPPSIQWRATPTDPYCPSAGPAAGTAGIRRAGLGTGRVGAGANTEPVGSTAVGHGTSTLFVSHDLAVVLHACDSVAVMYLGRLAQRAPRDALYAQPHHPYTKALLAAVPEPDPAVQRAKPRVPLTGEIPSDANRPLAVASTPAARSPSTSAATRFPPGAPSATARSRATWSEVQVELPPKQRMLDPGCFPCSSPLRTKLSAPFLGPQKSPTAAGIRASGLGVRERNDKVNLSPDADLSPKLGAWPIYSTSFFR